MNNIQPETVGYDPDEREILAIAARAERDAAQIAALLRRGALKMLVGSALVAAALLWGMTS